MADVRLSVEPIPAAGLAATYTGTLTATTVDYVFKNSGKTRVHVKKSGAGACTVTAKTPATVQGLDVAEKTFTVAATTGDLHLPDFPPNVYNDGNGDVHLVFSETTGLTVAVFEP